ncbi:MAG: LysR family transcriptional regulator [Chloroflexi bacterium]|nr:LysR family transcriptional regulator [Chloroflexota bacterium]
MLTLQQLQVFCTVAEHLHFTRAAEALNLTQPAVTFHIRSLERHFRMRLFDVRGHQVSLTSAGEFLRQRVGEVLNTVDAIERSMREFEMAQSGWLKLGTTLTIGNYVLPSILSRFHSGYARVHLSLEIANTEAVERSLLAREIDLGLVEGRTKSPEIEVTAFQTDELLVAVPVGHPLGSQQEVEAERLVQEPFILRERGSGTRGLALETLGPLAERVRVVLEMNSTEAIKRSVQAGLGVTIISQSIIAGEMGRGEIVGVRIAGRRMERDFSLAHLRDRVQSPATRAFFAFVVSGQHHLKSDAGDART